MTARRFTAALVDDEALALEGLRELCAESGLVEIVGEATDGAAGLRLIGGSAPDAVFLDISMPGLSGLQVARTLKDAEHRPLVVLVTAHDQYATEAFDLAVVDYVLKPIDPERMGRAIERVADLVAQAGPADAPPQPPPDFWLPFRGQLIKVAAEDIDRLDADKDYVRVAAGERSYLLRATLTDMLGRLDPERFLRIHRSIVVARRRITALRHVGAGAWVVVDPEGEEAPIGRSYLASVREALGVR